LTPTSCEKPKHSMAEKEGSEKEEKRRRFYVRGPLRAGKEEKSSLLTAGARGKDLLHKKRGGKKYIGQRSHSVLDIDRLLGTAKIERKDLGINHRGEEGGCISLSFLGRGPRGLLIKNASSFRRTRSRPNKSGFSSGGPRRRVGLSTRPIPVRQVSRSPSRKTTII